MKERTTEMDTNIGIVIRNLRKAKGISQESLAQAMGVSVQAVSKWETQCSYPDIVLIPQIAEYFGVSIDYLFTEREFAAKTTSLPDDNVLRVVQYKGNRMLTMNTYDPNVRIMLKLDKETYPDEAQVHIEVWGSADIQGDINGNVNAGDCVNCGNVGGSANAGDSLNCGNIGGGVNAGDSINCGNISGAVSAGDSIRCGNISGGVSVGDSITCTQVGGSISAGGDITCGDVKGDIKKCEGDIRCKSISGNVTCEGDIYYK
jgi:transcriptional regulator with XRE-family HTH domain